jgi:hypothetical protein
MIDLNNLLSVSAFICWSIVYFPQIYTNYKRQSGDGINLIFLYIWIFGDFISCIGSILIKLPITTILMCYFHIILDFILIIQVLYFNIAPEAYINLERQIYPSISSDTNNKRHILFLICLYIIINFNY